MNLPEPDTNVVLELERLRATVEVGNEKVQGQLGLLIQRGDQTDKELVSQQAEIRALAERLTAVERKVWTASGAAAVLGGAAGALAQVLGR
ncbi:hypothetical protein [Streptomyces sp. NPDC056707]|uniref:hypothetical protein n=1 Tax=Streptomyces sp. NPDC056707 TaxID=3345919 RepID=UPI0036CC9E28